MRLVSNGLKFHCRVEGTANRPWLVLSHAVATDHSLWDSLIPFLAKRYRILRYDARGHGKTDAPAGDYSLTMMCDDVVGLLDALQIDRAHFLGLSMGGMVGLGLALAHPERLLSSIVCDARASSNDAYRTAWIERRQQVAVSGMGTVVASSIERWFTAQTLRSEPDIVEHARHMIMRTPVTGYCGAAAALMQFDYENRLPEIALPVLYLVGQEDLGAPPEVMLEMHRRTFGSRFVGIPHAGHLSVMERPEIFATSVLGFLDELEVTGDRRHLRSASR
jgi:3-oxoadipate enol-lactonase